MNKKLCFLVDSIFSVGGVQRVTAVIAKELAKTYNVTIVTFDNPNIKDTSLYDLQQSNIHYRFFSYPHVGRIKLFFCKIYSGIYVKSRLSTKWASDLYAHSSFPSELRNALSLELQEGNYDIIIGVHAPLAARLATLRSQLPNTKLIGWLHNSYEALFGEKSQYIGVQRQHHYINQFKKLERVIVLCKNDANKYEQFDREFVPQVIYNPITLQPGKPSTGTSQSFLAIGRLTPLHKGIDLLIEAFNIFAKNNMEWKLIIVGEGVEKDKYWELIRQYHLEDRICIYPFTNLIQDFYSNAQIYVLSSRWEGMPLVLMEAMSHGLPIITSDLPVCKEVLGNFGLYFKKGDIIDLAQKLDAATHIDWLQKSQEAIEISKRFNVTSIVLQWKNLIESQFMPHQ